MNVIKVAGGGSTDICCIGNIRQGEDRKTEQDVFAELRQLASGKWHAFARIRGRTIWGLHHLPNRLQKAPESNKYQALDARPKKPLPVLAYTVHKGTVDHG
jgi:hypothetical protein